MKREKNHEWLGRIPLEKQREWFGPGAYKPEPLRATDPKELPAQLATIVRLCEAADVVAITKYPEDIGYRVVRTSDLSE